MLPLARKSICVCQVLLKTCMVPSHCKFSMELFKLPKPSRVSRVEYIPHIASPAVAAPPAPLSKRLVDSPVFESFYFEHSKRKSECEIQSACDVTDSDIFSLAFSLFPFTVVRKWEGAKPPGFSSVRRSPWKGRLLNCYSSFICRHRYRESAIPNLSRLKRKQ